LAINKSKTDSEITKNFTEKQKVINAGKAESFSISFQDIDTSQKYGSSFEDWQKIGLLSSTLRVLQGYCARPLIEQVDNNKFTIYGNFPNANTTLFKHPEHVSLDAKWARIHITGVAIIVGHIIGNIFFLVFLDKTHKFYLTKTERTRQFGKQYYRLPKGK